MTVLSAQRAFADALFATLDGALAASLNHVYWSPPVRATLPYAVIGALDVRDWSTKTEPGRELRFFVTLFEAVERADRLAALMDEADAAIAGMPRILSGWSLVSLTFLRSRILRGSSPWTGRIDYRARLLAA
jgi:hypothetical protein